MDLCFDRSGVWKWRLTTRTSSAVPRSCVKRTWHWGTWRTSRQRQRPLQSAAAWRGRTGWVVRCTAMWYSRVCEVPLLSVHWLCRWNPVLLCDTDGCVKCRCGQFIASWTWNTISVRLDNPAFCSTFKPDQHSVSQTFLLADPFLFSKNNHGSSHPCSCKYNFRLK
jgi:hypothetical protein